MRADSERGQTVLDFAIGISMFLIAVTLIFTFVPDLVSPFYSPGEDGDQIQAERTADHLTKWVLSEDRNNHSHQGTTLDKGCTVAFFNESASNESIPDRCSFDEDDIGNSTAVGLDGKNLNVSIRELGAEEPAKMGEDDVPLEIGPEQRTQGNVAVWSRIVYLDGAEHRMIVRVW